MPKGTYTKTSWSYFLIRLLFKFVLKIFYGTIVVENAHNIPVSGDPCIVCANHTNSLTDALLLVSSIPSRKRNMLRLTAKSTQFGRKTFTSWLIESAGTIPIKRRKDYADGTADNTEAMAQLIQAVEKGDAVCLFPEGASRYHPTIAPLKTGVARIVSDVLSRNRDNPDFEISVLTCSITYMHRQHFRSDVLVTFNPPMKFSPKSHPELLHPVDYDRIRDLTTSIHNQIASGTFDAPSWDLIRIASVAAPIYAPLGTRMGLGDHVRVTRAFLEAFKASAEGSSSETDSSGEDTAFEDLERLKHDLKTYHTDLVRLKIKDDRIRRPLSRPVILYRLALRLTWALMLFALSFPGLLLWVPIAITTFVAVHEFKKTGPVWDTWDEIAQYKLVYGFVSGVCVWALLCVLAGPFAPLAAVIVPAAMWMTLRWFEDGVSAFRAFVALARLLCVPAGKMAELRKRREDLHGRVMELAVHGLGLPEDPEAYFVADKRQKEKGRVRSRWESGAKYFSVRRRRKRDWNETLRLHEHFDYPADE